jgi:hypothetical protein
MNSRIAAIFILLAGGCIGTDYLEDPIVGARIEITPGSAALMPGQNIQLEAVYFDKYGLEQDAVFTWLTSEPDIATVDQNGFVEAAGVGQAVITATFAMTSSPAIQVAVVATENDVAFVEISAPKTTVDVGEKVMMTAVVKNINGVELMDREVEWFSGNTEVLAVSETGEVTVVAQGLGAVYAVSEGVMSNLVSFVAGSARTGVFVSAGGYETEGIAFLHDEEGNLVLEFSDDFKTSYALGTFVYLSNSTVGSTTFSSGFEITQITEDGSKRFDIWALDPSVELYDYQYVVILCKPARITFGYAELN